MPDVKPKRKRTTKSKKIKTEKKEAVSLELPVYDAEGKEVSSVKLEKEIFGLKINLDLVHQVVVSQAANRRKVIAHTKDRGEVRGGGRKPWRQKGTGRARAGSIRSPLWRGGGVTFGPRKERVFKKEIPKKIRRLVLFMVLSGKVKNNLLILMDKLKIEKPPKENLWFPTGQAKTKLTKTMAEILRRLPCREDSTLIVLPEMDKNLILAARNLQNIKTIQAKDLNALDLLSFKYLLMPKEAIRVIKETFLK